MKILKISAPAILAATVLTACAGNAVQSAGPARVSDGVLTGANDITIPSTRTPRAVARASATAPAPPTGRPCSSPRTKSAAPGYSVVMRDDGGKQWAYKGKPLYFWVKDQKPGDRTGDGFNGVWRVAKP